MGGGDETDGVVLGAVPLLPGEEGGTVLGEVSGDTAGEDMLLRKLFL